MPTATARKSAPTATVQETVIRKEVRDPIEVDATPPPVEVTPSREFWKYIQTLTDEDWKTHHVTLYRYPLGQVKPQKLGRYVRTYKLGTPLLSEEQVFEEWGGGQFDAILKGPPEPGGDRWTMLARHSWEMDGPAKNPWQTSGGNGTAPSELASTLQVVLQNLQSAQKSANVGESPAIKESISLIQQLTAAMPKQQGITELVQGLASLKALTGETNKKSELKETLELLKEMGVIGQERERKSLAAELKEVMELAQMMGTGEGGGRKTDWATSLVQNLPSILEKVTPIADKFADASRNNARVAELRAGVPQVPARPGLPSPTQQQPQPASNPAAVAPAAESPAPRTVTAPETEPAGASAAPGPVAIQPPNLEWVKARAVQLFAAGKSGDQIAEWLDTVDKQLGDFLGSMDEAKFGEFVRTDAILGQIATAPRFPRFVADFVAYFTEQGELEESAETPPQN